MTEQDTIKIIADLTMEWWVRRDELTITKKNNELRLNTIVKEDTTFELKYQMRTNELPQITIDNDDNLFEMHFQNKINRTKGTKDRGKIYKIMSPNDTLIFFTNDLGDKGGEVMEYFKFMSNYYPNEKEFTPIEVIEENEME